MIYRTHNCGEINKNFINKKVILCGWVINIKKFKYIYIIYIKDFYNVIKTILYKKNIILNNNIKKGYLLRIKGIVKINKIIKNVKNNNIEILIKNIIILNKSSKIPITYNNIKNSNKLLYKYKYLLFRNDNYKYIFIYRNFMLYKIRNFLYKLNFLEIDTPILSEYLSISGSKVFNIKINNNILELSQSPQIFKQLLMIGGVDKYYQIVKCFRNESYRIDRLIEFTQLDFEFSYITQKDIFNFSKTIINFIFKNIFNKKIYKFKKISYLKVIKKYGSDKPNLFFNFKIKNVLINKKKFLYFIIKNNKYKLCIKDINNIIKKCNKLNKYKIFYIYKNNIINYIYNINIFSIINIKKQNIYIIFENNIINNNIYFKIGQIINEIINKLIKYKNKYNKYYPVWIYNYPLFKIKKKKIYSFHHPFTSPIDNNNINFKSKSNSYDLVINGLEIASGSIRINSYKIQKKILNLLFFNNKKKIKKYFNFFLKALKFGAPPHGGIAFGLERILSLIFNKNITDIIPFFKKKYEK
ncbi:MAG: amino acid--tRNA ligase-related protein [Candidatus Shikimatogenerans sp. Tcar]|uniref:Amino acid--tRNA ligase-related protein n=1 Tax=Candidatus Shikimatogenerans sp. Tcar TaxID=3158565 RepID=A0AAU7QSN7_9FLAO